MTGRRIEIMSGAFFLLALLLAGVFLVIWAREKGVLENKYYYIRCYFDDSRGLEPGTPVFFLGKKIGQIKEVYLNRAALRLKQKIPKDQREIEDEKRAAESRYQKYGFDLKVFNPDTALASENKRTFEVFLEIQKEYQPFIMTDSKAMLRMTTSLGIAVGGGIDITLGTEGEILKNGYVIASSAQLDDIIVDLKSKAVLAIENLNQIFAKSTMIVNDLQATIRSIVQGTDETRIGKIVRSLDEGLYDFTQGKSNQKIREILGHVSDMLERDKTRRVEIASETLRAQLDELKRDIKAIQLPPETQGTIDSLVRQKQSLMTLLDGTRSLSPEEGLQVRELLEAMKNYDDQRRVEAERIQKRILEMEDALRSATRETAGLDQGNFPALLREVSRTLSDARTLAESMDLNRRAPELLDLTQKNLENAADLTDALKKHWLLRNYVAPRIEDPTPRALSGHATPYR